MKLNWRRNLDTSILISAMALSAIPLADTVLAQSAKPAASLPGMAPAGAVGLDSLSEQAVISELAERGLTNLVNRAFDVNKIPPADREGFVALRALRELNDKTRPLSTARRIKLIREAVDGLNTVLPRIDKVEDLMSYAGTLIERGIDPDINTLEYWGETPSTQAQVKPAVQAAINMLKKVESRAGAEANALAATMGSNVSDAVAKHWERLDGLQHLADYAEHMVLYYDALATNASTPAGKAARDAIAQQAIDYLTGQPPASTTSGFNAPPPPDNLQNFDTPESGVQALVHMRLGKLYWVKGDYVKARKYFQDIIDGKAGDKAIAPVPDAGQIFEAHFFLILTDLYAKNPDQGKKDLAELDQYLKQSLVPAIQQLPGTSEAKKQRESGYAAAVQLAGYRLATLEADLAKAPADKQKFDQQAATILTKLAEDHPEFQSIITEQLVNRLPEVVDMSKQSVPVLQALITKGIIERQKPEKEPVDAKVLHRAAAAAKEMSTRPDVPPKKAEDAALTEALFLDRLNEEVAAGNAYLDYAQRYATANSDMAGQAVDRAVTIAYQETHGEHQLEPQVKKLYGRALAVAVGQPFARKQLYYFYANYLRHMGHPAEAVAFYRAVPHGDPNEFFARFYALVALNNQLEDKKLSDADRKKILGEMGILIDQARASGQKATQNEQVRTWMAITTQLGADLALRENNPQRALQLLDGFEQSLTGLNPQRAASMSQDASQIRVNAYLATNQLNKAVEEVQKLAKVDPVATAPFISRILDRLSQDRDAASAAHDDAAVARIVASEASLTGYLVNWSAHSTDPKIKALAPQYRVYDANIKRQAGAVAGASAAQRKQFLTEALAAYQSIRNDLKASGKEDLATESTVLLGMGLTQYDLGNYKEAYNDLGTLIAQGRLGNPQLNVQDKSGEVHLKDNESYWEAMYKFLKSKLALAKANPTGPDAAVMLSSTKDTVKQLFIVNGDKTGGDKWASDFDALRKQILPAWVPGTPAVPTSQPVAVK